MKKINNKKVEMILVSAIRVDENQPRKYFEEGAMGQLKKSIEKEGLITPLELEDQNDGAYIVSDGERRFKVLTEKQYGLEYDEIPAIIVPKKSPIERKIHQFHIQEQHKGWTATEKAVAVMELREALGATTDDIAQLLSIPLRTIQNYASFAEIIDKKSFQRYNVGINMAASINGVKNAVKKAYATADIEFDRNIAKAIENAIYTRIGSEEIRSAFDLSKIKDSAVAAPKLFHTFLENNDLSIETLFTRSKAKGAMYLRKIHNGAGWLALEIDKFSDDNSVKVDEKTVHVVKKLKSKVDKFLNTHEI